MASESDDWENLRLGQLRRLILIKEYAQWAKDVEEVDASTLARDVEKLEQRLQTGRLTDKLPSGLVLTKTGEMLAEAFQPAISLCERLASGDLNTGERRNRCFRIGSGGSLASWLVGSRISRIRNAVNRNVPDLSPADRAQSPRIEVEVLKNRITVQNVISGTLDCGLVRKGVIEDRRLKLKTAKIGQVPYCLYVPKRMVTDELRDYPSGSRLPERLENQILEVGPIATVGPDGEFRIRLNEAIEDRGLRPNIELSYRAFPMLLPHMLKHSHATIMPNIAVLGGEEPPEYWKFTLGLLENYKREIFLIAHHDYMSRVAGLDFDELAGALSF